MTTEEIKEYIVNKTNEEYKTSYTTSESDMLELFAELAFDADGYERHSHRWWDEVEHVAKVGDKHFHFNWAYANRDESIHDLGWDFSWNTVYEVEPYTEVIEVMKYKKV